MRDVEGHLRTRQGATSSNAGHRSTVSIDEVQADESCIGVYRGVTAARARTSGLADARRIMTRADEQEIVCWQVWWARKRTGAPWVRHRCTMGA